MASLLFPDLGNIVLTSPRKSSSRFLLKFPSETVYPVTLLLPPPAKEKPQ